MTFPLNTYKSNLKWRITKSRIGSKTDWQEVAGFTLVFVLTLVVYITYKIL